MARPVKKIYEALVLLHLHQGIEYYSGNLLIKLQKDFGSSIHNAAIDYLSDRLFTYMFIL